MFLQLCWIRRSMAIRFAYAAENLRKQRTSILPQMSVPLLKLRKLIVESLGLKFSACLEVAKNSREKLKLGHYLLFV